MKEFIYILILLVGLGLPCALGGWVMGSKFVERNKVEDHEGISIIQRNAKC